MKVNKINLFGVIGQTK